GHVPESQLYFQLSLTQPLLLSESAAGVDVETGRGCGDGSIKRWPFDQQRHRFSQFLARDLRIRTFHQEGKECVIRRRRLEAWRGYGAGRVSFKTGQHAVDGGGEVRIGRCEPQQRFRMARDLV